MPKVVSLQGREADLLLQPSPAHPPSILAGAGGTLAQSTLMPRLRLPFAPGVPVWPQRNTAALTPCQGRLGTLRGRDSGANSLGSAHCCQHGMACTSG